MRFIIADDSYFFRNYYKRQLFGLGHVVVAEAQNGIALLKEVKTNKPDFVLTDIGMQPLTGLDASIEIIKEFPLTKILFSTSQNIHSWVLELQMMGINGYIYKNSGAESLNNAIVSSLRNEFYRDTHLFNDEARELIVASDPAEATNNAESNMLPVDYLHAGKSLTGLMHFNGFVPKERDMKILAATAQGKPVKLIASLLCTSERNIGKIKENMREKANVRTTAELLSIAYKMGWLQ